mmetsp:Transcript_14555/g.40145  ORF Transcript_14555/g.40145 Transcript_14555/m.40145 type:complete len:125 (-) Transcript_14555:40-414(-)
MCHADASTGQRLCGISILLGATRTLRLPLAKVLSKSQHEPHRSSVQCMQQRATAQQYSYAEAHTISITSQAQSVSELSADDDDDDDARRRDLGARLLLLVAMEVRANLDFEWRRSHCCISSSFV